MSRALEKRLGHRFANPRLLEQALTHRSRGPENNERLEFLGDGVLGCAMADELYARFPQLSEGKLTRLRASLVREEALAEVAKTMGIAEFLRLGEGEPSHNVLSLAQEDLRRALRTRARLDYPGPQRCLLICDAAENPVPFNATGGSPGPASLTAISTHTPSSEWTPEARSSWSRSAKIRRRWVPRSPDSNSSYSTVISGSPPSTTEDLAVVYTGKLRPFAP